MPDIILAILSALIVVLAPILYALLAGLGPGIPIPEELFTSFLLWLLTAIFGGGTAAHMYHYFRRTTNIAQAGAAASAFIQLLLYIVAAALSFFALYFVTF